uniref:Coenzyme A biosynthesis bifunctional protein CoaBC n=1 Tax=Magnetococcus massalia (strain MO-1) TaxID=451514 RepID=A0A1S7LKU9_MAGMO|nr:Coenzyme A biosynthesis bifunctional protein coaBC (DNA/pantothenate metabolism flavoprotein) [Includes: Phosphopantothenoylcysteine decarboxylase (CoaC); Phosphopantothenate--cysteine ligase (Phosphopantothenoylcysteine synthase) (CoaB)] [Candidatus Magnetococcus massalia]
MNFWQDKKLVIGVSGGIAAYKTLDLIRRIKETGGQIEALIATRSALNFVTPLSLTALSGAPLYDNLFSLTQEQEMGHIRLAREADLVMVVPATADLMARMAQGRADDLLTAMLLARRGPTLLAPAMNGGMWENPATQRNVATLQGDGIRFVGPGEGEMACGEQGVGRMSEPLEIIEAARQVLTPQRLQGRRILITAGPTVEAVDPVRYISNRSSGRMGLSIAKAARRLGADVVLIHGPIQLDPAMGGVGLSAGSMTTLAVESAEQMFTAVQQHWPQCDAGVLSAAVADYRPEQCAEQKIKKKIGVEQDSLQWSLTRNPDILAYLGGHKAPHQRLVGFAAETENLLANAQEKRQRKGCDLMVANDVSRSDIGFDSVLNELLVIDGEERVESWPKAEKQFLAERLMLRVADLLDR